MTAIISAILFVSIVTHEGAAASFDSDKSGDASSWYEQIVEEARKIYPLALASDRDAQLRFSFYVVMIGATKIDIPERSAWDLQARKWLLELVRNDKDPIIASNAAELLAGIVEVNALGFRKSERAAQCWEAVSDCWADVIVGKGKSAQCIVLVDEAQSC